MPHQFAWFLHGLKGKKHFFIKLIIGAHTCMHVIVLIFLRVSYFFELFTSYAQKYFWCWVCCESYACCRSFRYTQSFIIKLLSWETTKNSIHPFASHKRKSIIPRPSIVYVLGYVDVCMHTHLCLCECKIPKHIIFGCSPCNYKNSFISLIFSFCLSKICGFLVLTVAKAFKSLTGPSHLAHFN